jgi:hypothetical protein
MDEEMIWWCAVLAFDPSHGGEGDPDPESDMGYFVSFVLFLAPNDHSQAFAGAERLGTWSNESPPSNHPGFPFVGVLDVQRVDPPGKPGESSAVYEFWLDRDAMPTVRRRLGLPGPPG